MANKKTEFIVGVFVLLGIIALFFLALRAGNLSTFSFSSKYEVIAKFDNIGSLKQRAAVRSGGVLMGRVKSIEFDNQEFRAVVKMDLDSDYKFPIDSSATIKTVGLIGEQYIDLTPGGEEDNLEEGGEMMFTQGAMVLEDLISKFLFSTAEKEGSSLD